MQNSRAITYNSGTLQPNDEMPLMQLAIIP